MKHRFTLLLALLCASMMSFAAIDWSAYEWLGNGSGNEAYTNKFKVVPADGQTVVNLQKPGWAAEAGIYTHFKAGVTSCSLPEGKYAIDGAGVCLYLSAFTAKETEVTVVDALGSYTFTVYYEDGTAGGEGGEGGEEPDPTPEPEPEPEPEPGTYTANGHTIHLDAYYIANGESKDYTLVITSDEAMNGLGGSFWNVNGVGADMRSNMTISDDKKTIICKATSTTDPNIYTPLYVLMPGEVNFGNITLDWVDRTPIASEYCNYQGPETLGGGKYITLTWETDADGNVVITMGNGTGASSCSFRNGGFEGGIDAFVVSADDFVTTTPASNYFTSVGVYSGNTYTLTKIADVPAGAKIKHIGAGHALAWTVDDASQYTFPDFIYTYGGTCNQLDVWAGK